MKIDANKIIETIIRKIALKRMENGYRGTLDQAMEDATEEFIEKLIDLLIK